MTLQNLNKYQIFILFALAVFAQTKNAFGKEKVLKIPTEVGC